MRVPPPARILMSLFVATIAFSSIALSNDGPPRLDRPAKPLAEGTQGMVVGTTGTHAVHAGLEILKKGGSAADAAVATSLAQVVECGGAYVSHAGIYSMVYFDAASGQVHFLNACYDTPREEKEPLTIPSRGKPSGRTALVPGFMAGIQATHDRFGKLPRATVFEPAVTLADKGLRVGPLLGRFLKARQAVLSRLPETKRIFTKEDGAFFAEGDDFRQPELADTLRRVSEQGAAYMYTGAWAEKFVAAVQKEGGKITLDDLKNYQVIWEEPLRVRYKDHDVCVPGISGVGGVAMVEAMHLLEHANLAKHGHFTKSPESFCRLAAISHCQVLGFLPTETLKQFQGMDLTAPSRLKKETAARIWSEMEAGKWPFAAKRGTMPDTPPMHSDGVVVADRWGNIAAVTHSINTVLWGDTGIFVGGVSIPDSATFQQAAIKHAGPGRRLPDPTCPLIVLRDGKPTLASSAIGGGLHQRTLQVLTSVLDFDMTAQFAVEAPAFMLPDFTATPPVARVEQGQFDEKVLKDVNTLGQKTKEISLQEAASFRGYWIGVQKSPDGKSYHGVGTRKAPLPSLAEGY